MNWTNKIMWAFEDEEYKPKRKVDNKQSFFHHHEMGIYPSYKLGRGARYESKNEKLFFFLLDLDPKVVRYYEQPVEIPVRFLGHNGVLERWIHVPDVLVFREGSVPWLVQIKEPDPELEGNASFSKLQEVCGEYAQSKGWKYSVIFPKNLPVQLLRNIKLLVNFLHLNNVSADLINRIKTYLDIRPFSTVLELSELYQPDYRSHEAIPVIFHMIAKGMLATDLTVPVTSLSTVTILKEEGTGIIDYLEKGSNPNAYL